MSSVAASVCSRGVEPIEVDVDGFGPQVGGGVLGEGGVAEHAGQLAPLLTRSEREAEQIAQLPCERGLRAEIERQPRDVGGTRSVAEPVEPRLGDLAQPVLPHIGRDLGSFDRDLRGIELARAAGAERVGQQPPAGQRMMGCSFEPLDRAVRVLEHVPGVHREPEVDVGDPVHLVARCRGQGLGLSTHQLDDFVDQRGLVGNFDGSGRDCRVLVGNLHCL